MKKSILIACLVLSGTVFGQNTMRFGQINFAQGMINPAAISIDGSIMADFVFRNQWLGVEGAPTTVGFNGQYEFNQSMAAGLNVYYDKIGVNQTTSFAGQYAYRLHFDYSRALIFGLGVGVDNVVNNYQKTITIQENDPVFETSYSKMYLNGSLGIYFYGPMFYIGASVPELFQNQHEGKDRGFRPPLWHTFLTTGWYLSNGGSYTFNPHIQVKSVWNAPLQADLILRNTFNNKWSFVVGFRSEMSAIAGVDFRFNSNVRFGYSFNYDVGSLARTKGMSNEVYLGLAFPYHSDRTDFGGRRYYTNKGGHKSDFKKNSRRQNLRRGHKWGRKHRYR